MSGFLEQRLHAELKDFKLSDAQRNLRKQYIRLTLFFAVFAKLR